ncbi:MAG TPA: UDP-N-acetylglucosamine 2-epimerase (non-hydrolyzing) [Acidimicrobiales bacterium]|nr:UDP-N-acetylglucosamine 2-epimerase (non-hydrolyzing) [Acidimicrobiales bacterium]
MQRGSGGPGTPDVRRIMVVFGTRPEAIKVAPVILALAESPDFEPVVTVTAQHRDMLDQVLDLFAITPHVDLNIMQDRQTLTSLTAVALERLSPVVKEENADMVIVQGDTTTTFIGALSSFYHQVPVAHIEAGLRTGDRYSPYPEEINRRLTSQLTSLHLAPTPGSRQNLLAEGFAPESIVVTGNTVVDAFLMAPERGSGDASPEVADLDAHDRPVLLVTAHRRESWGEAMRGVGEALADLARAEPELTIVFPIHQNPVVREAILPAVEGLANIRIIEPLSYAPFARLIRRSTVVLTDSGGIQEEAPSLGKPVLVMRDTTERPEAVQAGTVRLVGTDRGLIVRSVLELLRDPSAYARMAKAVNPYGDGKAAGRVLAGIRHFFGEGPPAEEFQG